jgi:hypothetical protein
VVDVSGAKFSKELLGPEGLEVIDEELPELEDVVPVAKSYKTLYRLHMFEMS